jgi:hypothetical protein
MNTLSAAQKRQFAALIAAYRSDLAGPADPAAVEVLLILLEVCRILELLPADIEQLFTAGVLRRLRTWNGVIVHARSPQPPPGPVRRLWVWRPGGGDPQLYAVAPNRTIRTGGQLLRPVTKPRSSGQDT